VGDQLKSASTKLINATPISTTPRGEHIKTIVFIRIPHITNYTVALGYLTASRSKIETSSIE